mmetsp:Transcript_2419/g.4049  ORF Transcript_2419/g.4049 Transcript_2419/m.4049 type:complete len:102 (-) Transcript_2419:26-331(-)
MHDLSTLSQFILVPSSYSGATATAAASPASSSPPLDALPYPFVGYEDLPANQHPALAPKVALLIRHKAGGLVLRGGGGAGAATRLAAELGEIESWILSGRR